MVLSMTYRDIKTPGCNDARLDDSLGDFGNRDRCHCGIRRCFGKKRLRDKKEECGLKCTREEERCWRVGEAQTQTQLECGIFMIKSFLTVEQDNVVHSVNDK
jgi:hypothetical protein